MCEAIAYRAGVMKMAVRHLAANIKSRYSTYLVEGRKELFFSSLSTALVISDKIETWNQEETPFSSQIVPRGLSFAEVPYTAIHKAPHAYSDQANPLMGIQ